MRWSEAKKIINSDPEVIKELEENALEYEIKKLFCLINLCKDISKKQMKIKDRER